MQAFVDIEKLGNRVHEADELLTYPADTTHVRQAMARLEEADVLLAELVTDHRLTTELVSRLGRVRDELGGHLLAAAAMDELDIPDDTVAGVLQRGARVASAGISAVGPSVEEARQKRLCQLADSRLLSNNAGGRQ